MACVELSVFADDLCRTVCFCSWLVSNCLFLQIVGVLLSAFVDGLCRTVCLFLQLACVELSVFAEDLCRTVCFCRWLVSN